MTLLLTIPGRVQAWERTGGNGARRYTRPKSAAYKRLIATVARAAMAGREPFAGPVRVDWIAAFARPKRRPAEVPPEAWRTGARVVRTGTPDRDNIDKAILDGLTTAQVWGDDAAVVSGEIAKVYAARGEGAHVEVRVEAIGWTHERRAG